MRIAERILLMLSRPTDSPDCIPALPEKNNVIDGLDDLFAAFPTLQADIQGKAVLDYGCGPGWQTICLARQGAKHVTGLDINPNWLEHTQNLISRFDLAYQAAVSSGWDDRLSGQFDIVISKDSFEHFRDPEQAVMEMKKALRPGGKLFLVFTWPWYSPFGSHMQAFTLIPWVNLLFSERTVMRVRSYYRNDGAMRYEDVDSGLNKMSVGRSERILHSSKLTIEHKFFRGFKNWHLLTKIPLIRELFTQQVGYVLSFPNRM